METINRADIPNIMFMYGGGYRLNRTGLDYMTAKHKSTKFRLDKSLNAEQLIALSSQVKTPYFLSNKTIHIFGDDEQILAKLCGSIAAWLDMKT